MVRWRTIWAAIGGPHFERAASRLMQLAGGIVWG
jgi:hypothetical protein